MAVLNRRRSRRGRKLAALVAMAVGWGAACTTPRPPPVVDPVPEPAVSPTAGETPAGRVVPLPGRPEGLAFDPVSRLLAAGVDGGIALLQADGTLTRTVELGDRPRHLGLAANGGAVLVPLEGTDRLAVVALPSGEVRQETPVGRQPHDAAAAGGKVFVADELADTVSVLRGTTVIATVPGPVQPGGVAAGGGAVAIVGVRGRRLLVVDAATHTPRADLPAGVGPTHVVATRSYAYVTDTQGDAILVYRLGNAPEEAGRVDVEGAPYGIALDTRRNRLWVTLTRSNRLVEYEVDGRRLSRRRDYPTVRQPNTVAVDPRTGTVYVAGSADGELQILTTDARRS